MLSSSLLSSKISTSETTFFNSLLRSEELSLDVKRLYCFFTCEYDVEEMNKETKRTQTKLVVSFLFIMERFVKFEKLCLEEG
jgi:hypothetical protein